MSADLESKLCDVLGWDSNSQRTRELLDGLRRLGVKNSSDLDRESLDELELLTHEELELLTNEFFKMSVRGVLVEIFMGLKKERIDEIYKEVAHLGIDSASDFKHLDWHVLEESKGLSDMEVKKIMRYVQKNFPKYYEEHKKKHNEKENLRREIELYTLKIGAEEKLAEQQRKLAEGAECTKVIVIEPKKEKKLEEPSIVLEYLKALQRSVSHNTVLVTLVVYVTNLILPDTTRGISPVVTRVTVIGLYFVVDFIQFSSRLRKSKEETLEPSARTQTLPSTLAKLFWRRLMGFLLKL